MSGFNLSTYTLQLFLAVVITSCSSTLLFAQDVVISEYFNNTPETEWIEILVTKDNLDLRGYVVMDNNTEQEAWQGGVRFKNIDYWKHVRRGTIIGIWLRNYPNNSINNRDTTIADGRIMLAQRDTNYFEIYKFLPSIRDDNVFNIALAGDILHIRDAAGNSIHALGHKTSPGASWFQLTPPKLNSETDLNNGWTNRVFPGVALENYTESQKEQTAFGPVANNGESARTLPNWGANPSETNVLFWHQLRRPDWTSPTLRSTRSASAVVLTWNDMIDPLNDGTSGYLILRDSATNQRQPPLDGKNYVSGDTIGTALVIASLPSVVKLLRDEMNIMKDVNYFYRVYAYRFGLDDELGAAATPLTARGRQYNKENFASGEVLITNVTDENIPNDILHQNAPNPAHGITTITYFVPQQSLVSLTISDIHGRLVSTLTNEEHTIGFYTASFDASILAIGTYTYTLRIGSRIFSKRMTIV